MAINVVIPLLIDLEENMINATRLLPTNSPGPLSFEGFRFCAIVPEDSPISAGIANVTATHAEDLAVQYTITGGNRDGLFTIDKRTGSISLAARLDYELNEKHLLEVTAESAEHQLRTSLHVLVADVNDSPPYFEDFQSQVTVIEEEDKNLPRILTKASASDPDQVDVNSLVYSMEGEGVNKDTPGGPIFSIHPYTGEVTLLRVLDRDPPFGRSVYKLRVIVRDGQKNTEVDSEKKMRLNNGRIKRNTEDERIANFQQQKRRLEYKKQKMIKLKNKRELLNLTNSVSHVASSVRAEMMLDKGKYEVGHLRPSKELSKWIEPRLGDPKKRERVRFNSRSRSKWRGLPTDVENVSEYGNGTDCFMNLFNGARCQSIPERKKTNINDDIRNSIPFKRTTKSHIRKNISKVLLKLQNGKRLLINRNFKMTDKVKSIKNKLILKKKLNSRISIFGFSKENTKNSSVFHLQKASTFKRNLKKFDNFLSKNGHFKNTNILKIPNSKKALNKVRRDTSEVNTKAKTEVENDLNKKDEFCVLSNPRIQMRRYGGSFATQYEDLAPFMSRIYLETNNQHEVSTIVTVIVKDINDNGPIFPNMTMFGAVQENGPTDLLVTTVSAWDADDATSGTNALLSYSLDKNVVDEKTGEALFNIGLRTGELRTAVCCLDRETTPEYRVQVVASDGGGLKGTGTVVVQLTDVNDNRPRLSRDEWNVVVDETQGSDLPTNETLLEITVTDPDITNYFLFRVVEQSGKGWNFFGIRTVGSIGELYATKPLDYENEDHRDGFHFSVEVTDKGPGGWNDAKHIYRTNVNVVLRDVNDNSPVFATTETQVTVKEDVPVNTLLTKLSAHDKDEHLNGQVDYHLLDSWESLRVDSIGGIRVYRNLDREGIGGDKLIVRVVAEDRGTTRRSATATLTITLLDVNDSPPRLLPPHILHILENSVAQQIGILSATDDDIWSEGNGPPFKFSLANSNSEEILDKVSLSFDPSLDGGRGGAKLWTKKPLDREENHTLTVEITLNDFRGLTTSQPIQIVIDDVNDNMMKPGSKRVYLWKTKDAGMDASLGRIYVDDPDDWDLLDKSFEWIGDPHPLFSLHEDTGTLFASGHIMAGRYDLEFGVSDKLWNQHSVRGNVTVIVGLLSHEALTHSVPLSISLISPAKLTKDWNPLEGGGTLGSLLDAVKENTGARGGAAVVISVCDNLSEKSRISEEISESHIPNKPSHTFASSVQTLVWISYQEEDHSFMNPVKLRGLLEMNIYKIRKATNLFINVNDKSINVRSSSSPSVGSTSLTFTNDPSPPPFSRHYLPHWSNTIAASNHHPNPSSGYVTVTSLASTAVPLQVVDNNSTSFVSPRLSESEVCPQPNSNFLRISDECLSDSCLNGGKCVSSEEGKRCVCPGGTTEPFCKILSREFVKGGWAWINPLPFCMPTTISLMFMTAKSEGVILYSGPMTHISSISGDQNTSEESVKRSPNKARKSPASGYHWDQFGQPVLTNDSMHRPSVSTVSPLRALYLSKGQLHLSLEGNSESVHLVTSMSNPLNDGKWHSVHFMLSEKKVSVIIDSCSQKGSNSSVNKGTSISCAANHYWSMTPSSRKFRVSSGPLQVGGLTQRTPNMSDHGWRSQPEGTSLEGCISHLRINGELVDLGSPAYSYKSHPGCTLQQNACIPRCGPRGTCTGGLGVNAFCECPPGLTGLNCGSHTVPVSLKSQSFAKVALSFSPEEIRLSFQLRMRTRSTDATVFFLSSKESKNALVLKLQKGVLSLSVTDIKSIQRPFNRESQNYTNESGLQITAYLMTFPSILNEVRLEQTVVNDGRWHAIKGGKYEENLLLEVDNGDLGNRNESVLLQQATGAGVQPRKFPLDTREGVTIGGVPQFENGALMLVEDDLTESCLDDLRIQGRQVPLPLVLNETKWGQVTMFQEFQVNCVAPDSCKGKTCEPLLVCKDEWRQGDCRCPPGQKLTNGGCQEMDICVFGPCLNGGSCIQDKTGMSCLCRSQFTGQNCEWEIGTKEFASPLDPLILFFAISILVFLTSFVVFCFVKFRLRLKKRAHKDEEKTGEETNEKRDERELEIYYIYDQKEGERKAVEVIKEQTIESNLEITMEEDLPQTKIVGTIWKTENRGGDCSSIPSFGSCHRHSEEPGRHLNTVSDHYKEIESKL